MKATWSTFPLIRDGSMRALDLGAMTGIVTFPSFHAASAAIYLWALWPVKLLRPDALIWRMSLMIAATPAVGGHYFIDVVAGLALAAASIAVAGRICRAVLAAREVARPPSTRRPSQPRDRSQTDDRRYVRGLTVR